MWRLTGGRPDPQNVFLGLLVAPRNAIVAELAQVAVLTERLA
jgi:hypothetical protein